MITTKTSAALRPIESATEPASFPCSDTGNAELFSNLFGANVRYDYSREAWFYFHEHRWRPNTTAEVDRLALDAIRHRQGLALSVPGDSQRKAALKWALESENRSRRDNLLAVAAKIRGIGVDGSNWDTRPMLFTVQNGVVDLETGRLRDGTPADCLTKASPTDFVSDAKCPRFERFLQEIFADRPELVDYLQRVFGYTLTALTSEQVFWILFGLGANGKSTLIELLFHRVFGGVDYAWAMPFPSSGWSNALAEYQKASLVGRRFVTASEVTRRGHINEELVKSLTGDDTVNARHPYGRPFQFLPVAKFFLRVNDKPIIRDASHGMWRRVKLIEFNQTFPVDTTLRGTLEAEARGILAWCVRGAMEWRRDGLPEPACVQAATAEFRAESDPLQEFIADRCVVSEHARVRGQELYFAYRHWLDARQAPVDDRLSQKAFGLRIKDRFIDIGSRTVLYAGIGLRDESHQGPQSLDFDESKS